MSNSAKRCKQAINSFSRVKPIDEALWNNFQETYLLSPL